jgi:uncharacterized protein YggT (Ycf19 family)
MNHLNIHHFIEIFPLYNFSFLLNQENSEGAITIESITFIKILAIWTLNLMSYLYLAIKFFKFLCYAKMTCEWFPLINPYLWPFSFFKSATGPYFRYWASILPALKLQKSSVEISGIISLEALNIIIYFCGKVVNAMIIILEGLEKIH